MYRLHELMTLIIPSLLSHKIKATTDHVHMYFLSHLFLPADDDERRDVDDDTEDGEHQDEVVENDQVHFVFSTL